MELLIEEAQTNVHHEAIRHLETCVFVNEKHIDLPPLTEKSGRKLFRLLAREKLSGLPVATLSVAEGEVHPRLLNHRASGIRRGESSARYTRLAVRREWRGRGLHLSLFLEAQRHFITPAGIRHTWFLIETGQRSPSLLETVLRFGCDTKVVQSEYGPCRMLFRDELSITAQRGNRSAWAYIAALAASSGQVAYPMTPSADALLVHPAA
jgi:hypothetical protein